MMETEIWREYQDITRSGAHLQQENQIRFNSGSETAIHLAAKALVGHIGRLNDYRVGSEVPAPEGEIDVVLWGHPSRQSYAVELEHSPTEDVRSSKLNRYVHRTELDDMILINLNDAPADVLELTDWLSAQLGLEP